MSCMLLWITPQLPGKLLWTIEIIERISIAYTSNKFSHFKCLNYPIVVIRFSVSKKIDSSKFIYELKLIKFIALKCDWIVKVIATNHTQLPESCVYGCYQYVLKCKLPLNFSTVYSNVLFHWLWNVNNPPLQVVFPAVSLNLQTWTFLEPCFD